MPNLATAGVQAAASFVPGGSLVTGLVSSILPSGANPNIRPGHKALVDFFTAAADTASLNWMLTTRQPSGAMLYPTAALRYAQSGLAQVQQNGGIRADMATLNSLAQAWMAAPQDSGEPYYTQERQRINADLAGAGGSGPVNMPGATSAAAMNNPSLGAFVSDTASAALNRALAAGEAELLTRTSAAAAGVSAAAAGAAGAANAREQSHSLLPNITPTQAIVGAIALGLLALVIVLMVRRK